MDGVEFKRYKLALKEAAELKTQNTFLSAQVLQMQGAIDHAKKAAAIDRLMTAALLARFGVAPNAEAVDAIDGTDDEWRVELEIPFVNAIRADMSTLPGLHIDTAKDETRGLWVITLKRNPADAIVIHDCAACGIDHINPATRPVTEEERAKGILWVAICPEKGAEVFAAAAPPETAKPSLIVMP